jgi:hypothetical protein
MSGNFLNKYEATLQDTVPGIRRKIGIQALLNAMRSRTLRRNYALQLTAPAIDSDGDLDEVRFAGSAAWDNAMYRLFRPGFDRFMAYTEHDDWPQEGYLVRYPPWIRNPTNYWVGMMTKRIGMYFRAAIRRARKRLQNRYLENYSSGNPLVDLF